MVCVHSIIKSLPEFPIDPHHEPLLWSVDYDIVVNILVQLKNVNNT